DAATLARVAATVAHAIRGSLRFDAARRGEHQDAPGLMILDADNEVELVTPPAYPLLDAMRSDAAVYDEDTPPVAVLALATFVRGGDRSGIEHNQVTVPSPVGW